MIRRLSLYREPESFDKGETSDVYVVPYDMAKELYLDNLTDEDMDIPENQVLPKDVAKRLELSVKEVTVESFNDEDGCVFIRLKITGDEEDIDKVKNVMEARYKEPEQGQ